MYPSKVEKPKFFYGYIVVLSALLVMMLAFGTVYSFGVFLQPMLVDLGWTVAMTSGAYSLSIFMRGLLGIFAGRLTDRFGPRIVITICGIFLGLGYLLMSRVGASWQLYLFYGVIIAIGQSGIYVPSASTIARWFVKRRGMMTGIVVAGSGIGTMIMAPIAERLVSSYGWRTSYIIMGILVLVLITLVAQFMKRDPGQIGLSPYGVNEVKEEETPNLETRSFSLWEAINTRQLWMLGVVFFTLMFNVQIVIVHIVNHAAGLGVSAASAANVLAAAAGLSVVGKVVLGSIADRIGNKLTLIFSFVLFSVASILLLLAKDLWMLYLSAAGYGLGWGAGALMAPLLVELFGQGSLGTLMGILDFTLNVGGTIGPVLAGRIYDVVGNYQPAFLISALLSILSVILILLLRPPHRHTLADTSN